MTAYWVASEGVQRIRSSLGSASVTPAGRLHAVDPSTGEVACGTPLDALEAFPKIAWTSLGAVGRCRRCSDVIAAKE